MSRLLIVGAGGHGKVVAEAAVSTGNWDEIAFLDAKYPAIKKVLIYPVIGNVDNAVNFLPDFDSTVVAIGNSDIRMNIINDLHESGFLLPTIIHSTACISPSATLDAGSVVFAHAVINADARLGRGCIVNTSAIIEHDCCLEDGVHICPNASVGGGVEVGECSWIGIGSSVVHYIKIGDRVIIGAGAAVTENVEAGLTVVGVPAKRIVK